MLEVTALLESYKEALVFWIRVLGHQSDEIGKIRAAEVDDPLQELDKLVNLVRAHTTKIGIIFKPETLHKEPKTAYGTVQKLSESSVLLISIIRQLEPKLISRLFYDEILLMVNNLFLSNVTLVDELIDISKSEPDSSGEDASGRLVSVGKVWNSCDTLLKVLKGGKVGLLNKKFKESIALIDDGLDEFADWAENPEEMDDDPFGFSDDDLSEDENEPPTENDDDDNEEKQKKRELLIEFSKKWVEKIKLIKLLLSSLTKSLPSITSGETVNDIYRYQRDIVNLIDKLVVDLMMNGVVDDECRGYTTQIIKLCNKLVKVVREVNKQNESKVRWCDAWSNKFEQNLL